MYFPLNIFCQVKRKKISEKDCFDFSTLFKYHLTFLANKNVYDKRDC